ncbi:MAG: hypothetical protein ACI4MP_03585 [Candidatus Ventricola sp.]
MSTKEKLIAGGLAPEEAERIAAMIDAAEEAAEEESAADAREMEDGEAGDSESGDSEAEVDAAEEAAEESTAETGEAETGQGSAEAGAEVSALIGKLMAAELRACAMECGVDAKRMGVLMRLADTSGVDPAAENLHEQVLAAVKAALKEVPELARSAAASGALGEHMRTGANSGNDIAAKFRSGF